MKIKIVRHHKSIPSGLDFELPEFTVLTGENGSGKTHLFEALGGHKGSRYYTKDKNIFAVKSEELSWSENFGLVDRS